MLFLIDTLGKNQSRLSHSPHCHLVVGGGLPYPDSAQANSFDAADWCVDHKEPDT